MQAKNLLRRKGLVIAALLAVVLLLGAINLADLDGQTAAAQHVDQGAVQAEQRPAAEWTFQGRVYEGDVGVEPPHSRPLEGVTVSVYGANNPHPDPGTFIRSTTTNSEGWYGLPVYDDDGSFEFYHLRETDPAGYVSVGATTVDGTVRTDNWIEYVIPLEGKALTGNKFWDGEEAAPFDIPLEDVPAVHRRPGAQTLENVRDSDVAPGWGDARIGPIARPLYRPDVAGIAYYEFEVVVDSQSAGFIVVSTGEHDFPIAHWSFEGSPPTRVLELLAAQQGKQPAKFYKLDTLSYAAEDVAGSLAAVTPLLPIKVSGMQMAWLDQPVELTEEIWTPDHYGEDDAHPPGGGSRQVSGPTDSPLELGGWQSWQEMKSGYVESYGVLIEDLRRHASHDWQVQNLVHQFGEGLRLGETYRLALLCDQPTVTLSGPGTSYIQTELQNRAGLPPVYIITVVQVPEVVESPFEAVAACPSGTSETFKFWVLNPPTACYLPLVLSPGVAENSRSGLHVARPFRAAMPAGFARFWTFGYIADQRLYGQTSFYPPPTISSCSSGCGATAWAMLLGWADYQAGNAHWSYWAKNWGIYRPNGGYVGNERAPDHMTDGVRNMIWQIRDAIDTMCVFGSAPTLPSDMDEVSDYLVGRSNARVSTHYNVFGYCQRRLRRYAANSIMHRQTPAIIGTGWLSHYPLASAYRWWSRDVKKCFLWHCRWKTEYNRQFWVNQGWGKAESNGWIPARTWFAGEIYP